LCQKCQFFAEFFGENILKIITSVPGHPDFVPCLKQASFAEAQFCRKRSDPESFLKLQHKLGDPVKTASVDALRLEFAKINYPFQLVQKIVLGGDLFH
jgi:hypothetical protein